MRADGALERRFVGRRCLSVSNFTMFKLNEPHVAMSTLLESDSKLFIHVPRHCKRKVVRNS